MIDVLAHFGLTIIILIVDLMLMTLFYWVARTSSKFDLEEFWMITAIFNTIAFAVVLSFFIL